ncbi:hypothetical protein BDL97_10G057200 [Sphagnum fallax]|nr:hypothetical protein BDL97_10G057200 [Sphagnum fallax]
MSSSGTFLPPLAPPSSGSKLHINPSVLVIVVVLSVVLVCSGLLHLLARCLGRRRAPLAHPPRMQPGAAAAVPNSLHGQLQHLFQLHDAGVDQAFIDTLPVFLYGTIRGLKDGADCAVCLSEFGEEDRLRLLPKCKHCFHLDCIDTWLLSNSTCPLCRQSLLPGESLRSTSSSRTRARGPQSQLGHTDNTTAAAAGASCAQAFAEDLERAYQRAASSRGSSFRTCEDPDSGNQLVEIEIVAANTHSLDQQGGGSLVPAAADEEELELLKALDDDGASPMTMAGPTVCVTEADGSERVMRVVLGKVKFDSGALGSSYHHGMTSNGGFESATMATTSSAAGSSSRPDRSYSMGSYQYVVDSLSFELTIAPTPYPGRPQRYWGAAAATTTAAASKPTHRTVLSDSIPELAGGSSAAGNTPANENFFWASRGLDTPNSLSHAREMMTPSPYRKFFPISPSPPPAFQESLHNSCQAARAVATAALLHGSSSSSSSSHFQVAAAQDKHQQQCSSITNTANLEDHEDDQECFFTAEGDELHNESDITLLRRKGSRPSFAPLQQGGNNSRPIIITTHKNNNQPTATISASSTSSVVANDDERKELNDVGAARRSSSLRLLPGRDETAATNVRWFRRSLSDQTTGLGLGLEVGSRREDYHHHAAAAADAVLEVDPSSVTSTAVCHLPPVSTSSRKLSRLNWLMGRGRRLVYSAATPSPTTTGATTGDSKPVDGATS